LLSINRSQIFIFLIGLATIFGSAFAFFEIIIRQGNSPMVVVTPTPANTSSPDEVVRITMTGIELLNLPQPNSSAPTSVPENPPSTYRTQTSLRICANPLTQLEGITLYFDRSDESFALSELFSIPTLSATTECVCIVQEEIPSTERDNCNDDNTRIFQQRGFVSWAEQSVDISVEGNLVPVCPTLSSREPEFCQLMP
jgi:hypothetical protein